MSSIETLARVDVLCVDKTGTITEPGMQVTGLVPWTPRSSPPARWRPSSPPSCRRRRGQRHRQGHGRPLQEKSV